MTFRVLGRSCGIARGFEDAGRPGDLARGSAIGKNGAVRALLADAQTEAERLWASVPEWHWQKLTADEFSPPSFPPLQNDLT